MPCSSRRFPSFWRMNSCLCTQGGGFRHTKKTYWEEFLIYVYSYCLFHRQKKVKTGGSSLSPFVAQLSLQMVNLQLQSFGILLMRELVLLPGLAPTNPGSVHTFLPVPSSLEVHKVVYKLGPH